MRIPSTAVSVIFASGLCLHPATAAVQPADDSRSVPAGANSPIFPPALTDAKADKPIAEIDVKLAQVDRSQFDTEILLDKPAYEAAEIVSFVQQNIAFEGYSGVHRSRGVGCHCGRSGCGTGQSRDIKVSVYQGGFA